MLNGQDHWTLHDIGKYQSISQYIQGEFWLRGGSLFEKLTILQQAIFAKELCRRLLSTIAIV
jgi:hypothetical protein